MFTGWGRTAFLALVMAALPAVASAECAEDQIDLRGDWGSARFSVEVADDNEERARGLMFRESLPRSAGMLFIYPQPQHASFWMKNTLIPLDMIFADARGVVTRVHSEAIPGDLTPIDGGRGVVAVLEINGGLAEALNIAPGTQMRHPALGEDAAWSCAD
ncbi:DUF192 domain-containing protein [Tropicimonas aquimaris]|uniref:DUF192 domain-containing protein n=1 Tax=Tropicimonas aquimaris TaxID=914152 RepID=A0ABW3IKY8_9RHOB